MTQLIAAIISPLGTSLLLGVLALLLSAQGRRRWGTWVGAVALVWVTVWSIPAVSQRLVAATEQAFPPLAMQAVPQAGAIVVLGGGMIGPGERRLYPELGDAADRVWHAARLYHAGKAPLVLATGGLFAELSPMSEAAAMRELLRDLRVPADAVLLEERSRNTAENARLSAVLLAERGIGRVLLVTSASHMPRALRHFTAAGLEVIPVSADHTPVRGNSLRTWLPSAAALDDSSRAIKEWAGRLGG